MILLVSSSGGCFNNLLQLRPFWSLHERLWITPRTPMAEEALAGERVAWSFSPTTRNLPNLLRNLLLALRRRIVEQHGLPWLERKMMEIWGACQNRPGSYQAALGLARVGEEFVPGLLPEGIRLPEKNFHRMWKDGQD